MSISAFTAVLYLTGGPLAADVPPPVSSIVLATPALVEQQAPTVATPAAVTSAPATPTAVPDSAPVPFTPPPTVVRTLPAADTASSAAANAPEHGEIVVTGRLRVTPGDPLVALNAKSFEITQAVDIALIRPVARAYQRTFPEPMRDGIRNVINNLREPVVFVNFLLQFKPGKAFETAGRFAINTVLGGVGLVDVAKRKPFYLPRRANGLANTLGYYGVKPGPFLFLPLVGPTTLRDVIGDGLDRLILPLAVGKPFNRPEYGIPIYVFSSLDQRAEFDEKLQALHNETADPYVATREDYLRNRQAAIDALHTKRKKKADAAPARTQPAPATQP